VFQELPAHRSPAQQPAGLIAYGRHDEHGRDIQLTLAGQDGGSTDRGRPCEWDTHVPGCAGGEGGQEGPDADATARTSGGDRKHDAP
jgi:hypothetical protein